MPVPVQRSFVEDIDLFLVLTLAMNTLLAPTSLTAQSLGTTFFLMVFIHVSLSLYVGISGAARAMTWLVLIATFAGSQIGSFVGLILGWGRISVWLAEKAPLWTALGLVVLGLDLVAMHYTAWRQRSPVQFAVFLAAAVATAVVVGFALAGLAPDRPAADVKMESVPFYVVPPWHTLPFYAILRAFPDKLGGIVISLPQRSRL